VSSPMSERKGLGDIGRGAAKKKNGFAVQKKQERGPSPRREKRGRGGCGDVPLMAA